MRNEEETRAGIGIVGAGRLGTSLALALEHVGHPIAAVASARPAAAAELAARLGGAVDCSVAELVGRCELVVLAVPDDAIAAVVAPLAFEPGQSVVHCSGAQGLEPLAPARARGAACGCLHPLQSFPERFAPPSRFAGITCGIEGEGELSVRLEALCRALGATPLRLEGVDRARYHAAAVFANNYVIALAAAAARTFELAGLAPELARGAFAPLMHAAADSAQRLPLADALTGPLARADLATLTRHLAALAPSPDLRELYVRLACELLRLRLPLRDEQRAALEALLRKAL